MWLGFPDTSKSKRTWHCYGNCCTPLSSMAQQRLIAFCLAGYFVYGSDFFYSRIVLCCFGSCSCLATLSKMRRLIYCLEICTSPYLNTETAYWPSRSLLQASPGCWLLVSCPDRFFFLLCGGGEKRVWWISNTFFVQPDLQLLGIVD